MMKVMFWFSFHMALAYLMSQYRLVSTLHALSVVGVGMLWVFSCRSRVKKDERVLYLCAYITGAEILWRMTKALIFWEYGKYAVIFILLFTCRRYLFSKFLPWVYLLLMLPAAILTCGIYGQDLNSLRNDLSYNLSGPLALGICYACFSKFKISGEQFRKSILAICFPLCGVAFLCTFKLYTLGASITFGSESNFLSSGGFGPNQVSTSLGFGALLIFLYCLDPSPKKNLRNVLIFLGLWFAGQSALTFSRAGIAYMFASMVLGTLFFIQNPKTRKKLIVLSIPLFLVVNFVILPKLDQYTKGHLSSRFQERSTTNRAELAQDELRMFLENPLTGVGVGQAKHSRAFDEGAASHTEYSRLIAEHGAFGLIAIFLIFSMATGSILKAKNNKAKAFAVTLGSWALFFMLGNGMRFVMPAFAFGLASINIIQLSPKQLHLANPPKSLSLEAGSEPKKEIT